MTRTSTNGTPIDRVDDRCATCEAAATDSHDVVGFLLPPDSKEMPWEKDMPPCNHYGGGPGPNGPPANPGPVITVAHLFHLLS